MANTYTQLHIQLVFAVKYRAAMIEAAWKDRLYQYMAGIFRTNTHKVLQINGMPDHVHAFIGMRPHQSISDLMQNVKTETSKWIKDQKLCRSAFAWQTGFGAFSYSKSHVQDVIRYIQNQEQHHKIRNFPERVQAITRSFRN